MVHASRLGPKLAVALLALVPYGASAHAEDPEPPPAPAPASDPERDAALERAATLYRGARESLQAKRLDEAQARAEEALGEHERLLGPQHATIATTLTLLGDIHRARGSMARAREAYARALAIREAVLGPDAAPVASSLNNLGIVLRDLGDLAAARPHLERAVALLERLHGPDDARVLIVRNTLGDLLQRLGDFPRARALLEQVLAGRERALGPDHPQTAETLQALGMVRRLQGDYADARRLQERAALALEKALGPRAAELAPVLNDLAWTLVEQGLFTEARPLLERSLSITMEVHGPRHRFVAAARSNLAEALRKQGEYAEARVHYGHAIEIAIAAHGEDHPNVVTVLTNLGILLTEQGEYAEARSTFERALAILDRLPTPPPLTAAAPIYNFALLLQAQARYAEARILHERALALRLPVLGEAHPGIALSLNNLALIHHLQGELAEARPLYERALRLREKAHGPDHPEVARVCNNLAALHQQERRYDEARALYERALSIWERAVGRDHPDHALALANLAWLARVQGDDARSRRLLEEALETQERLLGPDHPRVAGSRHDLALALERLGALGEARDQFERSLSLTASSTQRQLASLGAQARVTATRVALLRLQGWLAFAPKVGSTGYAEVLRVKGLVGRAEAAERALARRASPEALAHVARLRDAERRLARLANQVPPSRRAEARAAWQAQYAAAGAERERLARDLAGALGPLRAGYERLELGEREVAASLGKGEALVDLLRVGKRYLAWVVRSEGPTQRVDLGPAEAIEEACQQLRQELAAHASGPLPAAARLRTILWTPIEAHLGEGTPRVWIAPDGALASLPWAALPGAREGTCLIDERTLGHVMHAFDLVPATERPTHGRGALLVGGVDYDRASVDAQEPLASAPTVAHAGLERAPQGGRWRPLPGTLSEIEALQARLGAGQATVLRGGSATESALRTTVRGRRILHIATHGFAREDLLEGLDLRRLPEAWTSADVERQVAAGHDPMLLSGVVLAGGNPREGAAGDDGILTSLEASYLDLDGVELVTLSACETARGTAAAGEGVLGLTRAFQMAGASSVLASLWKVDDAATRELMEGVYERLLRSERPLPAVEALRGAALELRDREDPDGRRPYASPRHWAAFVAYGR